LRLTGLYPGASALLQISGAATLDGTLDVSLAADYTPVGGDRLRALTFGSRTEDFTTETGFDLGPGLALDPQYDATSLTLVVYYT
jgi:hypothetical protein